MKIGRENESEKGRAFKIVKSFVIIIIVVEFVYAKRVHRRCHISPTINFCSNIFYGYLRNMQISETIKSERTHVSVIIWIKVSKLMVFICCLQLLLLLLLMLLILIWQMPMEISMGFDKSCVNLDKAV